MRILGKIDDSGKPEFAEGIRGSIDHWFKKNKGYYFFMELKRRRSKRTLNQNDAYFGVWLPIIVQGFIDLGYNEMNAPMAHSHIKNLLLRDFVDNGKDEWVEYVKDTHDLDTDEFGEFLQNVETWAQEDLGITLPAFDSAKKTRWR